MSLAQKPKSAAVLLVLVDYQIWTAKLTNLDVATPIEQNIVTLDISVNDVLVVQVLKTLASL